MRLFWRHLVAQWLDSQHTALRATKVKGQSGQHARDPEPGCQAFRWEAPSVGGGLVHKPQVLVQIPLKESLQVAMKVQERGTWALCLPPTPPLFPGFPRSLRLQLVASCLKDTHSCGTQIGRNKRASHREKMKLNSPVAWSMICCPGQHPLSELQHPSLSDALLAPSHQNVNCVPSRSPLLHLHPSFLQVQVKLLTPSVQWQ